MARERIIMEFVDGDRNYFAVKARGEMFCAVSNNVLYDNRKVLHPLTVTALHHIRNIDRDYALSVLKDILSK